MGECVASSAPEAAYQPRQRWRRQTTFFVMMQKHMLAKRGQEMMARNKLCSKRLELPGELWQFSMVVAQSFVSGETL